MMRSCRYAVLLLVLFAAGCVKAPILENIIDGDTLPERISDAEIVIFGKLLSIDERAITKEEKGFGYKRYIYYDLAKIEVVEVIKGTYEKDIIFITFLSFDQTQPDQQKIDCRHFSYHDIWNPGIWLIDVVRNIEPPFNARRGNYVPSSKLDDVKSIIENSRKHDE